MTFNVKTEDLTRIKLTRMIVLEASDFWYSRLCIAWFKFGDVSSLTPDRKNVYYQKLFLKKEDCKDCFLEDFSSGNVKGIPLVLVAKKEIYHKDQPVRIKKLKVACTADTVSFYEEKTSVPEINKNYIVLRLMDSFDETVEEK